MRKNTIEFQCQFQYGLQVISNHTPPELLLMYQLVCYDPWHLPDQVRSGVSPEGRQVQL